MQVTKEKSLLFFLDQISWILVLIFYLAFAMLKPQAMLNLKTLHFMIYASIPIGFIVIAEAICLITGNFDLSVGQIAGLAGMASATVLLHYNIPVYLALLLPIFFGALCGMLNGFLVGFRKLNPFLVTLGTFIAFDGLTLAIQPKSVWGGDLPELYMWMGSNEIVSILIFIISLVILALLLKHTRFGIHLYSTGGDRESTSMLGVNTGKMIFFAFTISGILCGFSALMYTGFCNGVPMNMADGALFPAFAGAVIGGVSLTGGRGSVIGAFGGILLVGVLQGGLSMLAVSPEFRMIAFGFLVIAAILIDKARATSRDRLLRHLGS